MKYYKYFVPDYSKWLTIELRNNCPLKTNNCSLRLSVFAKALPSSHAVNNCTASDSDGCVLHIEWPQPATNYYIEVSGTSSLYEITANHTGLQIYIYSLRASYPGTYNLLRSVCVILITVHRASRRKLVNS